MSIPFLSRTSHEAIVEALRTRIAELVAERDYYRDRWTEQLGPVFSPVNGEPPVSRSEAVPDLLDAWTVDDRDLFWEWARERVAVGEDAREVWRRTYGTSAPLEVMTV